MAKVSSPKPVGATITGSDYNQMYEDLFSNHAHSANRDGGLIDHDSLTEDGNPMTSYHSHAVIDAHINAGQGVHGIPVNGGVIYKAGSGVSKMQAGIAPSANWVLEGSPWYAQTVTFPEAFSAPPVIVCTPLSGGTIDRMHWMVSNVSTTGFKAWALGGAEPDNQYEDVQDQNLYWMALGT